jgi:ribose transport system permease protein
MSDERISEQPPPKEPTGTPLPDVEAAPGRTLPLLVRMRLPGPMLGLLVLLALFILILAIRGQLANFLSLSNVQGLLHQSAIPAIIGLGMLLIIISGGIDLSVGSVVALVTVVTMQTFRFLEARPALAGLASLGGVLAGVYVGGVCGLINGLTITRLKVSPFVATLGMLSVARGLAFWLSGRTQISFRADRPGWVTALQTSTVPWWQGVDPGVWSALILAALVAVLLRTTVFGRYCYAIGSNEATARLCGIDSNGYKLGIYVVAGLLTGWAGILVFAHGNSGSPNSAVGLELDVIAAVVIGGATLGGGQGTVFGTLLGVLILGILENGVSFCQVPVEIKYILIGAIVIVNTALSQWQRRQSE